MGSSEPLRWDSRGNFFVAAAEAMRRILVENAQRKQRIRHGGQFERLELNDVPLSIEVPGDDILALKEALDNFECVDSQAARVVQLHYFLGLPLSDTAALLGISE